MTNLNEITYVDWQFALDDIGSVAQGIDDINQCIALILNTPKGSVPHRPTFGSDIYKYVDYPINIAKASIIRETIDAISLWEQRISVNAVVTEIENEKIKINVQWTLKDSGTTGSTEVTI